MSQKKHSIIAECIFLFVSIMMACQGIASIDSNAFHATISLLISVVLYRFSEEERDKRKDQDNVLEEK